MVKKGFSIIFSEEIEVRPIKIIINETNCLQPGHQ